MDIKLKNPFMASVKQMLKQMASIEATGNGDFYDEKEDVVSYGVSSIISFSGRIKGRLLLDMHREVALHIAENIISTRYETVKDPMVLAAISELNNIISGDAITKLNNEYSLGLRLAPPIVFTGKDTVICIPKIASESFDFTTPHGNFKLNIAFEGGV